ncbi:lysophospholipid acyltransferase family protein [Jannaschia sp. M317]|uniref:lysophospholipid acyltransferase family protein n=1 Tax=Jannaschia sp. M317 TaxID=2867011 RepID=UPI0021A669EB|nr:lysophospholipid acyltransferase family protein [Jannaschia sp. M317]UWQ17008.1 lysophospholipid acyltransferase family protein [Jannaschia sp. M317]
MTQTSRSTARQISYATGARTRRGRMVIRGMELLGGRSGLLRRARGYDAAVSEGTSFWEEMCRRYGLRPQVVRGTLSAIPATGPVVVVANHPYGILDGLVLSLILSRARPGGFRVIANDVFLRAPDMADVVLPVSFDDSRAGRATNLAMRRTALSFLAGGGLIGVFPGGAVSTPARPFGPARDPHWRGFSAKLIRQSGATVVPIHFEGANSRLFHLASHLHATLRLGLLIREFGARTDGPVRFSVGDPISPAEIAAHPGNQTELMDWLRCKAYAAGDEDPAKGFEFDTQKAGCT